MIIDKSPTHLITVVSRATVVISNFVSVHSLVSEVIITNLKPR